MTSAETTRVTVDGEDFDIRSGDVAGHYHYDWLSGPNQGYGFTSAVPDGWFRTSEEHVQAIRDFLSAVDPTTGYIEDEDDGNDGD